jgi:signal transduction histidine kinase
MNSFLWPLVLLLVSTAGLYFILDLHRKNKQLHCLLEQEKKLSLGVLLRSEASETKIKTDFDFQRRVISILIHDLRSPLFFMEKIANNLAISYDLLSAEDRKQIFREITKTTTNITVFVTDILRWLDMSRHSYQPVTETFVFNDFVKPHYNLYIDIANEKKLQFELKSAPDFQIATDKNNLGIIIRNMIDNAIKYTDNGKVSLNGYASGGLQYVVIEDTGRGMPLEKAFELEKGVITKKSSESTQIGFRIVYDLVKKMNGEIRVVSSSAGTKIRICLPERG